MIKWWPALMDMDKKIDYVPALNITLRVTTEPQGRVLD